MYRFVATPLMRSSLATPMTVLPAAAQVSLPSRSYATPAKEMSDMVKKAHYKTIIEELKADPRVRMPHGEFVNACKKHHLADEEIAKLGRALHDAGIALHFPESPALKDVVITRPEKVLDGFIKLLDSTGQYTESFVAKKTADLERAQAELTSMQASYQTMRTRALKSADRFITISTLGLLAQGAAVARLTWWELSWDIMEPVTYMITFAVIAGSAVWFSVTKTDYTYESLHETLTQRKLNKLVKRSGFDLLRYNSLKEEVNELEAMLRAPEQHLIDEVVHD